MAWVPIAIVLGIIISAQLADITGIWKEYIGGVVLPAIGLLGAWFIAPVKRLMVFVAYYLLGVAIAYVSFSPSLYPDNHPLAYQSTYTPLLMAVGFGAAIVGVMGYTLRLDKPARNPGASGHASAKR